MTEWNARLRPRDKLKRPPPTYWEEYVETDEWYRSALLEDIPDDEMHAACEDSDFDDDSGEEGDSEPDELSSDESEIPTDEEDDESESEEGDPEEAETSEGERGSETDDGES